MDEEETLEKALILTNKLRELGFIFTYVPQEGYETWIMYKKLEEKKDGKNNYN